MIGSGLHPAQIEVVKPLPKLFNALFDLLSRQHLSFHNTTVRNRTGQETEQITKQNKFLTCAIFVYPPLACSSILCSKLGPDSAHSSSFCFASTRIASR